jgi:hypothetical protein
VKPQNHLPFQIRIKTRQLLQHLVHLEPVATAQILRICTFYSVSTEEEPSDTLKSTSPSAMTTNSSTSYVANTRICAAGSDTTLTPANSTTAILSNSPVSTSTNSPEYATSYPTTPNITTNHAHPPSMTIPLLSPMNSTVASTTSRPVSPFRRTKLSPVFPNGANISKLICTLVAEKICGVSTPRSDLFSGW